MGPADVNFANLNPVNAATTLRGALYATTPSSDCEDLFVDSAESLTADVWNIFLISRLLAGQKLLQFKITNNSGGISTIETAFMRLV